MTIPRNRPMREVDQALARAYAQRGTTERGGVPAPHLPTRTVEPEAAIGGLSPHFAIDDRANVPTDGVTLHWPATIRTLERTCGDRFARMADGLIAARDQQHLK